MEEPEEKRHGGSLQVRKGGRGRERETGGRERRREELEGKM